MAFERKRKIFAEDLVSVPLRNELRIASDMQRKQEAILRLEDRSINEFFSPVASVVRSRRIIERTVELIVDRCFDEVSTSLENKEELLATCERAKRYGWITNIFDLSEIVKEAKEFLTREEITKALEKSFEITYTAMALRIEKPFKEINRIENKTDHFLC